MKRVLLLTMVLFFSAAVLAQQTEVPIPDGLVIPVEIKKTLNPKKMQVGDPVALEVTKDVRGPDGEVLIPKRAKAAGRVTAEGVGTVVRSGVGDLEDGQRQAEGIHLGRRPPAGDQSGDPRQQQSGGRGGAGHAAIHGGGGL
jgi:hypothetical protein